MNVVNLRMTDFIGSHRPIFSDAVLQQFQGLQNAIEPLQNIHSDTMRHLISSIGSLDNTFSTISNIDFSGLEALDIEELIDEEEIQEGNSDLASSITVTSPEKKLKDMTEGELDALEAPYSSRYFLFRSFYSFVI